MAYHGQLTDSIEDQLTLASIHYQRSHFQEVRGFFGGGGWDGEGEGMSFAGGVTAAGSEPNVGGCGIVVPSLKDWDGDSEGARADGSSAMLARGAVSEADAADRACVHGAARSHFTSIP